MLWSDVNCVICGSYRRKMRILSWKCSEERSRVILIPEIRPWTNRINSTAWKEMSSSRLSIGRDSESRPMINTSMRETRWTRLLIKWSMKTMKWWELIKWNKNNASKIWSSLSTRKKHYSTGRGNSRNMKRNWSEGTPVNSRTGPMSCRLWKRPLKLREMPFSGS